MTVSACLKAIAVIAYSVAAKEKPKLIELFLISFRSRLRGQRKAI